MPLTPCEILCKLTYSLSVCLNATIEDGCCDCCILIVFYRNHCYVKSNSIGELSNAVQMAQKGERGSKGWWGLGLEDFSPKRLLSKRVPVLLGQSVLMGQHRRNTKCAICLNNKEEGRKGEGIRKRTCILVTSQCRVFFIYFLKNLCC